MESNAAEELASLTGLQATTRREVVRAPRWVLPLMLVSVALFFLAYSIPGFERVGWLVWLAYVWGVVIVARRRNRAKAPSSEMWRTLAAMIGLLGGSFVLAAVFNDWVGGIAGGVAGIAVGGFAVWRERRR